MENQQSKSFAYLLGSYLGDGSVKRNGRGKSLLFRLNTIDEDFRDAVAMAIGDLSELNVCRREYPELRSPKSPKYYVVATSDQSLCRLLVGLTDEKGHLPEWILDAPKEVMLEFTAGLMDSEGYVSRSGNKFTLGFKSCDPWVRDFGRLLEVNGFQIGQPKDELPRKTGYRIPTRFSIKLTSWVRNGAYFKIGRKQSRVEDWRRQTSETTRRTPQGDDIVRSYAKA